MGWIFFETDIFDKRGKIIGMKDNGGYKTPVWSLGG
jgi:hypothetical protein